MQHLNSKFPDIQKNLEILAEECAEVIQIKSKIVRFGLESYHPKNKHDNRYCLTQEIGDVMALVKILIATGVLSEEELEAAMQRKLDNLSSWY